MRKLLAIFVLSVSAIAQVQIGSNVKVGGGSGTINSGTTDGIPYYSGATTLDSTSAGTAGQVMTSNGAGVAPTFQTASSGASDYISGTKVVTWLPNGGSGYTSSADGYADINGASPSNNAATSTTGYSNLYVTSGVINNSQGFGESPTPWYAGNARLLKAYTKASLALSAVEILHWFGFTDQAATTMLPAVGTGADNPAGNYAGIYFCNTASTQCNANGSKTNWFCVLKNGTTQTVADTGVAADTASHSFYVAEDASNNWSFKIDGTAVCGAISQTNKPTAASLMRVVNGIDPLAAAGKRLAIEGVEATGTK